jgi:hypothetical protein
MTHKNDRVLSVKELARVEGEGALYLRARGNRVEEARLDMLHAPDFLGYRCGIEMATARRDIVERGLKLKCAPSPRPGSTWTTPSSPASASRPSATTTPESPARLTSWI